MRINNYYLIYLFAFVIFFEGCNVCNVSFKVDNGNEKYSIIEELDYAIQIDVEDSFINVNLFTSRSSNIFIKDRGVDFILNEFSLVLINTMDSLLLINEKERFYSCKNFEKKILKNNKMYLKLGYSIDSVGIIKNYSKEYWLTKQKNCKKMLRVH